MNTKRLRIALKATLCMAWAGPLAAQIVAHPGAPGHQQPTILLTPNGLPLVNIQTPSAAGVSHNMYSVFNVQAGGVVLNNSRGNTQSQLGGWIQGNPWLAGGSARVILNEINSSNPSYLNGFVEVAGQRAEVVIANPAGIRVNGGGFINASRATLTTGKPIFNGAELQGYRVERGSIDVEGAGLLATGADQTALLARAIQVNAGIWANDLKLVTGAADVSADIGQAQAHAPQSGDAAPAFALDVAALGGMYAGKITLVGTEAGVGVRNAGHLGATSGDLVLDAKGWLSNSGTIQAQRDVRIATQGTLENSGTALAGANATLQSAQDIRNSTSGRVLAVGQQTLSAGTTLHNSGVLEAGQALHASARDVDNTASGEIAAASTLVHAQQGLTNRGLIDGTSTQLQAETLLNIGTGRIFGDHVAISAGTLTNDTETVNGQRADAVIAARERLDIGAQHIVNREGALIFSAGDMVIGGALDAQGHATGQAQRLHNASATIESLGDMHLSTEVLSNTNEHLAYVITPEGTTHVREYVVGNLVLSGAQVGWTIERREHSQWPFVPGGLQPGGLLLAAGGPYSSPQFKEFYLSDDPYEPAHQLPWGESGNWVPDQFNYGQHSPVWAAFGMVPPAWPNPGPKPGSPPYYGSPTQQELDDWTAKAAPWLALNAKITEFRAAVNGSLQSYNQYRDYTQTTQTATLTSESRPGRILSGGAMHLYIGQSGTNRDSHIVAGQALNVTGVAVQNESTAVNAPTLQSGAFYNWGVVDHDCDLFGCSDYYGWVASPLPPRVDRFVFLNESRLDAHTTPNGSGTVVGGLHTVFTPDPATGVPLPTSGLFKPSPDSASGYLLETDPRFASYRQWLGSDYLLNALGLDATRMHKRLGDGFYEQRLVREQIGALTGHRFLADHTSDEAQYQALMNAGATFAKSHQLQPGVALTAAQVVALTSDIVWLETQTINMPDGSRTQALVPRVYVVPREGDLQAGGALLAGREVNMNLAGDLHNSGTVAGRQVVRIGAENIRNEGGTVSGQNAVLQAHKDIHNIGGSVVAQDALVVNAGRDLVVQTTTVRNDSTAGTARFSSESVNRVAGLYVSRDSGTLVASAGRDVQLTAALLQSAGALQVDAGRDLKLGTVNTSDKVNVRHNDKNHARLEQSAEVGSQLSGQGKVSLRAARDIDARAASVQADGVLMAQAGRDVRITAGEQSVSTTNAFKGKSSGALGSSSLEVRTEHSRTDAVASNFGGQQVFIDSGRDIAVQGSGVISDKGTTLLAERDVSITAAQTRSSSSHFQEKKQSGFSTSGMGVMVGKTQQSNDQNTTRTGAAGATVGAIEGDVTVVAGRNYRQVGSDLFAPGGDVNVLAKDIAIVEAREREHTTTEQKFKQSGVTLSISAPVISALQGAASMGEAVTKSRDERTQALGAAVGAMQLKQAYQGVQAAQDAMANGKSPKEAAQIGINLSLGSSKSESRSETVSDRARGSTVSAGGSVTLAATGAGQGSNLLIQGSEVQTDDTVRLIADNRVDLLAAANTTDHRNSSKNSSASVGVGMSFGAQGAQMGYTVSASKGKGSGAGQDVNHTNTRIEAGRLVSIESGGDTTLQGAVVAARQVQADIGGDLRIESLQDSSHYRESNQQKGASLTFGAGAGASINASRSRTSSDHASVSEQSGLRAGDGGFQVSVRGKTELVGGAITSSERAVQQGVNDFESARGVVLRDIENRASYEAKGSSMSAGVGDSKPTGSAGLGADKGSASSTTVAAISGIAGQKAARTGDQETGLAPIFDKERVKEEIGAQVAVTAAFSQQAPKAWADHAEAKQREALKRGDAAEAAKWAEGGEYRAAGHAVLGLLSGGAAGAAGALTSATLMPEIGKLIDDTSLPSEVKQALGMVSSATLGAVVGGQAGAGLAFGVDTNNRQLHPSERKRIGELAQERAKTTCRGDISCEQNARVYWSDMLERAAESRVDAQADVDGQAYEQRVLAAAARQGTEAAMGGADRFFVDLGVAQQMLDAEAGRVIVDSQGHVQLGSDGRAQTYFSATKAQRDDPYGNIHPLGSPRHQSSVVVGKERRDAQRLERLNTLNGLATPDATLEETLLGVRVPARGAGAAVQTVERGASTALPGTAKAAEEALLRSGGAFDQAGNPLLDMSKLSSQQKGVAGELFGEGTVRQIVPDGQKIARMPGVGENGIDDLYKVNRPDVDYVFIEYKFVGADGKTGAQVLGKTGDGVQGSEGWIGGSERIEKAVGSIKDAERIYDAKDAGRIESWVVTTRPDGSTYVQVLDAVGKPKPIDTSKIALPATSLSGAKP